MNLNPRLLRKAIGQAAITISTVSMIYVGSVVSRLPSVSALFSFYPDLIPEDPVSPPFTTREEEEEIGAEGEGGGKREGGGVTIAGHGNANSAENKGKEKGQDEKKLESKRLISKEEFLRNLRSLNESPLTVKEKPTNVIESTTELEGKTLIICVVGTVSTGKTSLIKAFFGMDPEAEDENDVFQVDIRAGTTQCASGIMVETPPLVAGGTPGKILIFDLPGLHEASDDNNNATLAKGKDKDKERIRLVNQHVEGFLHKDIIDIGIFVVDSVVTDDQKADYDRLCKVAKKVFLVHNKIDLKDYLKPEVREKYLKDVAAKFSAENIFPTCCKGYDRDADRSRPDWLDIRGIEELRTEVFNFAYKFKQAEFIKMVENQKFWKNMKMLGFRAVLSAGIFALAMAIEI